MINTKEREDALMMWGKHKENGVWLAPASSCKVLIGGGDRLIYFALGRFRLRLMKPF